MNLLERLIGSIRRRGWWRTALLVPGKLAICLSKERDRWFDRRHGTVTRGIIELDDLDITSENKARGIRYEATRARPFEKMLEQLRPPRDGTFVDLGCGMGRILLLATDYGFRRVVGVDFSEKLCRLARENADGYSVVAAERIVILHEDATRYAVQSDDRVFYFFNPFDAVVMRTILDNVLASHRAAPRDIYFIYNNPVWRRVFEDCPEVSLHSEHCFAGCFFLVYRIAKT